MILLSCTQNIDLKKEKENLKQTDIEFSNHSIKNGMKAAFLTYLHDEGVMLRKNSMPVVGFEKVAELLSGDYSQTQLSWKPSFVKVAKSGDLGYTFGTYDMLNKLNNEHSFGTYVTIWEKDSQGDWKMILDSGNEGI